jgi:hypothetical protein
MREFFRSRVVSADRPSFFLRAVSIRTVCLFGSVFCLFACFLASVFLFYKNASAESFNVRLDVAICNNNMICEEVIGENYQYCPSDCEAPPPPPPATTTPETPGNSGGYSGGGYNEPPVGTATGTSTTPLPGPIQNATSGSLTKPGIPAKPNVKNPAKGTAPQAPLATGLGIDGIVRVAPFIDHATLNFRTFLPSLLTISWGKTGTYELGASGDTWYHQNFSTDIGNLDPGTRYYYHLELLDSVRRTVSYEGSFVTAFSDSESRLPLILDLAARQGARDDELVFTWNIKPGFDTAVHDPELGQKPYVRLVRSDDHFPTDPLEGKVIYEGSSDHALDIGLVNGHAYFYSAFLLDKNGNKSSPAILYHLHSVKTKPDSSTATNVATSNNGDRQVYDPLLNDGSTFNLADFPDSTSGEYPVECDKLNSSAYSTLNMPRDQGLTAALGDFGNSQNSNRESTSDVSVKPYKVTFMQDGSEILHKKGDWEADGEKKLFIRVRGPGLEDQDMVGACFFSYAVGRWNYYILTKNNDGSRELIFPELSSVSGGKIYYQFAMGVLKYKGKIEILEHGQITFNVADKRANFSAELIALSIAGISLIMLMVRRI